MGLDDLCSFVTEKGSSCLLAKIIYLAQRDQGQLGPVSNVSKTTTAWTFLRIDLAIF